MIKFLFDEKAMIEYMLQTRFVDRDNVYNTINYIARYNYFVMNMDDDSSYNMIIDYIKINSKTINEESIFKIVNDCVKKAKKYPLKRIGCVNITKNELNIIQSLNDIKKEKIVFVLLATAKYYNATVGSNRNIAYLNVAEICKLARVAIPANDRNIFMQFLYDDGIVATNSYSSSIGKKVAIISEDDRHEIALTLTEKDYKDLAYTYLSYKEPHKFRRCTSCGKYIRKRIYNNGTEVQKCKECAVEDKRIKANVQYKTCIDCQHIYETSVKDTSSCRCEECQHKIDRENTRKRVQKYRETHMR